MASLAPPVSAPPPLTAPAVSSWLTTAASKVAGQPVSVYLETPAEHRARVKTTGGDYGGMALLDKKQVALDPYFGWQLLHPGAWGNTPYYPLWVAMLAHELGHIADTKAPRDENKADLYALYQWRRLYTLLTGHPPTGAQRAVVRNAYGQG